jgi:ankyrin repeat protein
MSSPPTPPQATRRTPEEQAAELSAAFSAYEADPVPAKFLDVRKYLSQGADPNVRDEHGDTLLARAVTMRDMAALNALLAAPGIDLTLRDAEGLLASGRARAGGREDLAEMLETAERRAAARAALSPEQRKELDDRLLYISLHSDGTAGEAQSLLDRGADVNARNTGNHTPLMFWTMGGHVFQKSSTAIGKTLLAAPGIDVNVVNHHDNTALINMARDDLEEVIDIMLARPELDLAFRNKKGLASDNVEDRRKELKEKLQVAEKRAAARIAGEEYFFPEDEKRAIAALKGFALKTALDKALLDLVESGQDDPLAVKNFLSVGADPNARDGKGDHALLLAVRKNLPDTVRALAHARGININAGGEDGWTALGAAAAAGRATCLSALLCAPGIDVNTPGRASIPFPPLHLAATYRQGETARMLVADPRVDLTISIGTFGTASQTAWVMGNHALARVLEAAEKGMAVHALPELFAKAAAKRSFVKWAFERARGAYYRTLDPCDPGWLGRQLKNTLTAPRQNQKRADRLMALGARLDTETLELAALLGYERVVQQGMIAVDDFGRAAELAKLGPCPELEEEITERARIYGLIGARRPQDDRYGELEAPENRRLLPSPGKTGAGG